MSGAGCLGQFAQAAPGLRGKKKDRGGTHGGTRVRSAARGRDPRSRRDVSANSQSPGQSPSPPEVKRRAKPSGGAKKVAGKAPGKRGGTGRAAGKRRSKTRAVLDAALGRPDGSGEWDGDDATAPGGVINVIVTDVDGTLLNSSQELTMRTEVAIARAAACGVPVILATGKSRGPWARRLLPKLPVPMPGVFIQGLLTCDADGTVLESIELDPDVASDVIEFAEANGASLVAFCASRILCSARDENTDLVLAYGEPAPEAVGNLRRNMVDAGIAVNKLLLFADEDTNAMPTLRASAEKRFDGRCSITVAVPGMLEFLPKGASKGAAVERLLKRLDIDPRNVLALGDGENDVEMLRLAGTAVAMAGSGDKVVAAAGGVVGPSNDDNGVAAAIEKYVLSTRGLPPASEMGKISPLVEIDDDEADELLAAVGVEDVKKRTSSPKPLPSPKAAAMAIQSETIRKKLEKEAAKKRDEEEEETTTVAKEEAVVADEPTRAPDLGMEEARRMNAELLEASKAAAARLAALRGTLKETEEELKRSEETQARKAERRAAEAEKARVRREKEETKSEEPSLADVAAAAETSANLSGWDDDDAAADSWEIAAESEQAAAVAAAASEAARRAEAAVVELEAAAENDRLVVEPEVATAEDAGRSDASASSSRSSSSRSSSSRSSSSSSSSSSAASAWGSIGSFFSAALKTVTSLTSPEARAKQAEAERAAGKAQLLAAVVSTNIGRDCDLDQLRAVETAVLQLESLNPTKAPMKSSLTKGRWSAVFTSSRQLLGLDKKLSLTRQSGPIYWAFDAEEKRAEVSYTWPVKVERASMEVTSEGYKAELEFEQTKVFGLFSIGGGKQREYAELEVTYLDLDLMVARGGGNTLYVLVQTNSNYRIGDTTSNNVNKQLR